MKKSLPVILFAITGVVSGQVNQPVRPVNFSPYIYEYSVEDLHRKYSKILMEKAREDSIEIQKVIAHGPFKPDFPILDRHRLPEWFQDAKFGIFFDWGLWSVAGYGIQGYHGNFYPDTYLGYMYRPDGQKIEYHKKYWGDDFERDDFIPLFTASKFNADSLAVLCRESGAKYVVPFAKHQDGYCIWSNSYTHRNSVRMPPHRDFLKEMYEAFRKQQLKCGFYYCLYEFEYPVIFNGKLIIRTADAINAPDPLKVHNTPLDSKKHNRMISGKIAVANYLSNYVMPSLKEVIDRYSPDLMWFDAEWYNTTANNATDIITAYYYNVFEGKKEVAVNDRLGTDSREKHGDFYTSEYNVIVENLDHYWEENRPMGVSYGYNWQDTDKSLMRAEKLIEMLVRIVARNGNLLLMVCPDATGTIPPEQVERLREIGVWLKTNGEAIYGTRAMETPADPTNTGAEVWYTQRKDGRYSYAIFFEWPVQGFMMLKNARPKWESKMYLLGHDQPLKWYENTGNEHFVYVELPKNMTENISPCKYAWVIKYENW